MLSDLRGQPLEIISVILLATPTSITISANEIIDEMSTPDVLITKNCVLTVDVVVSFRREPNSD